MKTTAIEYLESQGFVGDYDLASTITNLELPSDDPKRRQPDITKAKKVLNWQPTTKLEEGLKKTIDYFKTLKT